MAPNRDPGPSAEALYATGYYLCERAQYREALRLFRAFVLRAPTDERAWLALGHCKERLSDPRTAIKLYAMGALAIPDAGRCCAAAGRLLLEHGEAEAADAAFERAARIAEGRGDDELTARIFRERGAG